MWAEVASFLLRPTFFMLVAFVVTFLVTRYVTTQSNRILVHTGLTKPAKDPTMKPAEASVTAPRPALSIWTARGHAQSVASLPSAVKGC